MYLAPVTQLTQTQFNSTIFIGVEMFEVCVSFDLDKSVRRLGGAVMSTVPDGSAHGKLFLLLQFISGMIVLQPVFVDSERIYIPVLVERDGLLGGD